MSPDPAPQKQVSKSLDDAYWSALFTEEPKIESPVPVNESSSWQQADHSNGVPIQANHKDPWQEAQIIQQSDHSIQLLITGYNKGGLIGNWSGLQGFIPASQLIDFPQFHLESARLRALKHWLNRKLTVKIVDINPAKNRLIFSERAALVDAGTRDTLLNELVAGKVVSGTVTNLTRFGAFVDLGGVEGLIHISELSWSRVSHPGDIVQPGQEVTVIVMSVDQDNERVALSLKQLIPDPWQTAEERYQPGQIVEGVVTNVVHYGAFVLLEEELEGLIHISELAEGTFLHPRNVISRNERVKAKVLYVNAADKRLALSLRQLERPEE